MVLLVVREALKASGSGAQLIDTAERVKKNLFFFSNFSSSCFSPLLLFRNGKRNGRKIRRNQRWQCRRRRCREKKKEKKKKLDRKRRRRTASRRPMKKSIKSKIKEEEEEEEEEEDEKKRNGSQRQQQDVGHHIWWYDADLHFLPRDKQNKTKTK